MSATIPGYKPDAIELYRCQTAEEFPAVLHFLAGVGFGGKLDVIALDVQGRGCLFFENGRLVHAAEGRSKGIDAIARMLVWQRCEVHLHRRAVPPEREFSCSTDNVLMDAALLADQNAALWLATTPRRENVPEPNPPAAAVNLSLPLPSDRRSATLLALVLLLLVVLGVDGCRLLRGCRRQRDVDGSRPATSVDFHRRLVSGRPHHVRTFGLGMELLAVPGGRIERLFADDESGQRRVAVVTIAAFWLGRHEVNQDEYAKVMGANPSAFVGLQRPVETVSWLDAQAFCERLTGSERVAGRLPPGWEYRLPTEMEWEYACRAEGESLVPDNLARQAWFRDNAERTTHPVGTRAPNRWGFFDLFGNVNEWCLDWLGRVPFAAGDAALQGELRGCRGGSWSQSAEFCHPDKRVAMHWESANNIIGFRIALAPVGQLPELAWKR